ncbi:MAG: CoA transferase, partial [Tissierellia bacterium]|nr:CoA transferase [Tissierellia bacterium]
GKIKVPGIPIKLSDTPGDIRMTSPLLGQHTEEILKELLNYDDEKIEELKRADIF